MTVDAGVRFLVCGMPRSGTTLLAELLARSPDVEVAAETHFLALAPGAWWTEPITRSEVLAHLGALERSEVCQLSAQQLAEMRRRVESAAEVPTAPVDLLFWLLAPDGRRLAAIGEKTPRHLELAERALAHTPDLRVVVVVRDPRDVHRSLAQVGWNRGDPVRNGLRWRRYGRLTRHLGAAHPDRVLVVRFEDVVRRTDEVVGEVQRYLVGREHPVAAAGAPATFSPRAEPWKSKAVEAPDASAAERWRRDPQDHDVAVSVAVGAEGRRFGYQRLRPSMRQGLRLYPQVATAWLADRRRRHRPAR